MAIPFLNNISLNNNEIQNVKLHNTGTISSPAAGHIYFDTDDNIAKYYNGSAWIEIVASTGGTVTSVTSGDTNTITIGGTAADPTVAANTAAVTNGSANLATGDQIYDFVIGLGYTTNVGDITRVNITAGDGLTGTVDTTSGDHTQIIDVVGGDGITANADEIEVSVDDTTIELSASDGTGVVRAKTAAIADGGTALATADQIHTFVTGYADPSGTDNSTNVTLAGSLDYITISGQVITRNAINLATDITGTLPIANGGTGQTTAAAAANALLNTSQGGSLTIGDGSDSIVIPGNLTVTGTTTTNNVETVSTSNGVIFEGNAADDNELTLLAGTLTDDRTVTLPNETGTVALTSDIPVSGTDFDPVGTDNSTDVTLTGSYDYITISGQTITRNQIDYNTDIANLPTIPSAAPVDDVTASTTNDELGITISPTTGNVVVGLDVTGLTEIATDVATDDEIIIYDKSFTANRKVTIADLMAAHGKVRAKRIVLLSTLSGITRAESGGVTTFTVDVTDSSIFGTGTSALDVMCEVIGNAENAGDTVYADIGRSVGNLTIAFNGSVANSDYQVLLNLVGDNS